MSDGGYTLSETLAAMVVLGMAIGGLTLGAQVIAAFKELVENPMSMLV